MIAPYAATPVSPAILMSWKLYSMLTMDMAIFVTSSETPFDMAFDNARPSKTGFTIRRGVLFRNRKNTNGVNPPTD